MAKRAAYGTRLIYRDPADLQNRSVHFVADIAGPDVNVETIDVTTHDSPDHFNEFIPGMANGGDVNFELIFDAAAGGHARIIEMVADREPVDFLLYLPAPWATVIPAASSDFSNAVGWTLGGTWAIGLGVASCVTPAGGDALTRSIAGLVLDETVVFRVRTTAASSGQLTVAYGASFTATINALPGRTFDLPMLVSEVAGVLSLTAVGAGSIALDAVQVLTPDGASEHFEFSGLFTKVGPTFPVKDAIRASASVKVSGKPVFVTH